MVDDKRPCSCSLQQGAVFRHCWPDPCAMATSATNIWPNFWHSLPAEGVCTETDSLKFCFMTSLLARASWKGKEASWNTTGVCGCTGMGNAARQRTCRVGDRSPWEDFIYSIGERKETRPEGGSSLITPLWVLAARLLEPELFLSGVISEMGWFLHGSFLLQN